MSDNKTFEPPTHEKGAALLTVLLLVSVMAVIAATALDRLTLSTKIAANSNAILQSRSYILAAENIALSRIADLLAQGGSQTTLAGDWNGRTNNLPIAGGFADIRTSDGGNCFNINSLVERSEDSNAEIWVTNQTGVNQFIALMTLLGISSQDAQVIAESSADWIDSDTSPSQLGAEDQYYQQLDIPYRTANILMIDRSELRSVKGVESSHYNILKPWLCALPIGELSPINVNTLLPEQAILVSMLVPDKLTIGRVRSHLANRPVNGYGSRNAFWNARELADVDPSSDVASQIQVKTRWFDLEITINLGNTSLVEKALIDASENNERPLILHRSWGV